MAKKSGSASVEDDVVWEKVSDLLLDNRNPRLVEFLEEDKSPDQDELLRVLWEEKDVEQLVMSISTSGYIPYEPLLVSEESGKLVVIEGNRLLAAVKLLLDPALRKKVNAADIPKLSAQAAKSLELLPCIHTDRESAWKYLGVKHINGPQKWDSYAKAQYISHVADKLKVPLNVIAEQIGDRHNTVQSLYRSLKVIEQAEAAGVFNRQNREKKHFSFSHLETGLRYENIAAFIGLKDKSQESPTPVAEGKLRELGELCVWLFGDKTLEQPAAVQSQNPDLRHLNSVLGHREAVKALRAKMPLQMALEISRGDAEVIQEALMNTKQHLQIARGTMSTGFSGDAEQLRLANEIADLAADLAEEMDRKSTKLDGRRPRR